MWSTDLREREVEQAWEQQQRRHAGEGEAYDQCQEDVGVLLAVRDPSWVVPTANADDHTAALTDGGVGHAE